MINSEILVAEKLFSFLREYTDSPYCLELLRFFGKYPRARFSSLAVAHALDINCRRLSTERVLDYLVRKGVVKRHAQNNDHLYSLTDEEGLRGPVLDLAKMEWRPWQLILKQLYPDQAEKGIIL